MKNRKPIQGIGLLCYRASLQVLMLLLFINGYSQQSSYTITTCDGVPVSFAYSGAIPGTTYTWSDPEYHGLVSGGSGEISPKLSLQQTLVLDKSVVNPTKVIYKVKPSNGTDFTLTIVVTPDPKLVSNRQIAICSETSFNYVPLSTMEGVKFTWSRALIVGISNKAVNGDGNPNEILKNLTSAPIDVQYIYSLSINGCRNDDTVFVMVKPTPFLTSSLEPVAICSGETFNYTPTTIFANTAFSWTRMAINTINNGVSNSGTGNPEEHLYNSTTLSAYATYVYNMTDNATGCTGTQNIRVEVKPVASISPKIITTCSENNLKVSPQATEAPIGTRYTWEMPKLIKGSVTGETAVSVGQNYVHQELKNTSNTIAELVYTIKPLTFGCQGADFTVTVNVTTQNTKAILSSTLTPADICSGTPFRYLATTNVPTGMLEWERFYSPGISNTPDKGLGNNPDETLINRRFSQVSVHYAFTITADGCSHTQDVIVPVNPGTTLNNSLMPPAVCSNTMFDYFPQSLTATTHFNWTRAAVEGVSNPAASGSGDVHEVLVNTSNKTVELIYNFFLITANDCIANQKVVVRVNPTPLLTSPLVMPAICGGTKFNYEYTSNVVESPVYFQWSRPLVPSISNGIGIGINSPSEILVNTSAAPITVPYTYTLLANDCANEQVVTVVINPVPKAADRTVNICSGERARIIPTGVPEATMYTWDKPVIAPLNSLSGTEAQLTPVNEIVQDITTQSSHPATAIYTITPITENCVGTPFILSFSVNPVPMVDSLITASVCSGTSFEFNPTNVPEGTVYTWGRPMQHLNSLSGASAQPINVPLVSQTLRATSSQPDTATYRITPRARECTGKEILLKLLVTPIPVINNIIDTVCSKSAFMILPANVPPNTLYTWSSPIVYPFGAVANAKAENNPVSVLTQLLTNSTDAPAQVVYTVKPVANNCVGSSFQLTVVVGNMLPVFNSHTINLCSGNSFDATPSNAPEGTLYKWDMPTCKKADSIKGYNAQPIPRNNISQTLTNHIGITEKVIYDIQPTKTGCMGNMFTITVNVLPAPTAVVTGKPVICRHPEDTLVVKFTGMAPWAFTYTDGLVHRTVSKIMQPLYSWKVPASSSNIMERTLAIHSIVDNVCSSIDTVVFVQKINALPRGIMESKNGEYICNNIAATLYVNSPDVINKKWMLNGKILPDFVEDSLKTLTPGSYNAILTTRFGCIDTAQVPLNLRMVITPVVQFGYDTYCINKTIHFTNRTDTTGIGKVEWIWGFGDSTEVNSFNSTHTYLKGGKHHVKLTARQLYCPTNIIAADSTLDIQYSIPAVRLSSVSAYNYQPTPLAARALVEYKYEWVPSKGIDNPFVPNPNFNYETNQEYIIQITSPGGCITKDSILVRVFNEDVSGIIVPKAFTPNNDGINDALQPYMAGLKTFHYFRIFNRFGKLLFETRNPDAGWNGNFNGVAQPMGIYVWVSVGIKNDGSKVERKGQTLLIR